MAELAGWTGVAGQWPDATLHHVAYGMVQGADGRKLSSRDGSDMTLQALLDEGQEQSLSLLSQSSFYDGTNLEQPEAAAARIASSAIRYHDLSHQRAANYVFRFDDALATRGNSALYVQYALARIRVSCPSHHCFQSLTIVHLCPGTTGKGIFSWNQHEAGT